MNWMVVTLGSVLVLGAAVALLVTVGPLSTFASSIQAHLGGTGAQGLPYSGNVETIGRDQWAK